MMSRRIRAVLGSCCALAIGCGAADTGGTMNDGSGGSAAMPAGNPTSAGTGGTTLQGSGGSGAHTMTGSGGNGVQTMTGSGGSGTQMTTGTGGTALAGSGGTNATSGGSGGSGPSTSTCDPPAPSACDAAQVRITEIDVGAAVVVNEDDAALKMLSISAIPSGGSRVAWLSNDDQVHVSNLDCDDHLVDSFGLPAMDYGDIHADDAGGVLLLTRDAKGGGTLNCGEPTNLCGTPPSPAIPCYDMYMVRFDGKTETWATKLTTASDTLPPYSTGPTGPQTYFIWWYAHHGRLAFDGTNWAGYYGAATSVSQMCTSGGNTAINIHQGDEMRVVSPSGMLVGGQGFDWGCSHSGFEKITYDASAKKFAMICRSDGFPNAGLNVNASKLVSAISPTDSSVSNLVVSRNAGSYWALVTNTGELHLFQFTPAGGTSSDISMGSGDKPHLVTYGSHMFAAWAPSANANMIGQVLDAASGEAIGSTIAIDVPGHAFEDFREFPDGSAAYAAPGSGPSKIKIVRVLPCAD